MEFPGEAVVIKLWETLAEKGIGKLLSPWQTRRDGRAQAQVRADEMLLLAQAEADANDLRAGRKRLCENGGRLIAISAGEPLRLQGGSLIERTEPTLDFASLAEGARMQEIAASVRAEINTSRSVLFAEETLLSSTGEVPSESVDDDWLSIWRDHVSKVSSEDMQRLWGNVLAGEVQKPGQYSLRTLDFLRTLSQNEAELISILGPLTFGGRIYKTGPDALKPKGVTFDALLHLQDLGIITGVEGDGLKSVIGASVSGKFQGVIPAATKCLLIEHESREQPLGLPAYVVTKLGLQVLSLGHFDPDVDYLKTLGRSILNQGFKVSLCDWAQQSESSGVCSNPELIT